MTENRRDFPSLLLSLVAALLSCLSSVAVISTGDGALCKISCLNQVAM